MVNLSPIIDKDPTLEAADLALVKASELEPPRPYLGMSSIGESCSKKLWYRFRHAAREEFDADTLKRFADGHAGGRCNRRSPQEGCGRTNVTHGESTENVH